ncbi:MCE family protein [Lujinxingia vulgaris]|uniref:MCE family protein n=1 Tax=Lujinxingia vulgaris TaxID=2600176 RepID=A0A5C6XM07_9DELT|nr:MlaD family protein [Lujinxingia vulgaris]TXD38587.1 MCE family protein [Lujinxingia vulgaris]
MKLADVMTPFKVGLLVIAGVAATVVMVTLLSGDMDMDAEEARRYYAHFDDVTGLAVKSRIQMAGIPVGTIDAIRLDGSRARVEVSVRGDVVLYEGQLNPDGLDTNGAALAKRQASLIGDYYLELTPGTEGRVLENGDPIRNIIKDVGPDELFERLNDITKDIQQVTNSLATVFGGEDAQRSIQQMLDDMQNVLATLNQFVATNSVKLDQLVTDASNIGRDISFLTARGSESIDTILRDTEAIVQEVRYIIGQSTTDVQAGLGTMQGTLARLQRTLDSLNYSLQNVQDITEKINEGEGTVGELINNPTIAYRTEQILDDAGDFLGRVTRLRTIVELRSEYHLQNQQLKNVFGLRLEPNEDKYYMFEFVDDFRGSTSVVTERVNTTDPSVDDALYQETRTTTTDEFKFSLVLGRSFQASDWLRLGGRFGIIESTGGIGATVGLFPDRRLEVQTDLFDFSAAENPRLRAYGTYRFLEFAYISGGIDDVINPDRRDYFIGAGIRFDDEDLKALLTTTGVPTP